MFVCAESAAPLGIAAQPICVEVHRGEGLPGVVLVGLARGAAKEALVRVRSALQGLGVSLGSLKLTVSLLPAEVPKEGSALDLALAAALLATCGRVPIAALAKSRFYGELSLAGEVQATGGTVRIALLAKEIGDERVFVAPGDCQEAKLVDGIEVVATPSLLHLQQALLGLEDASARSPAAAATPPSVARAEHVPLARLLAPPCLSHVIGQAAAKRALIVAAAGGHNLLLVGPPGSGKSMLAQALPALLPPLSRAEQLMQLRIEAACGERWAAGRDLSVRPFRAPHHSASAAALLGGGTRPQPGEITLAHDGVLFLDELPEFAPRVLESLRGPLEDGSVLVSRQQGRLRFPARSLLVAAMNPCPCGYWLPHEQSQWPERGSVRPCLCAFQALTRYRSRLSGPLLDRLDVRVFVDEVAVADCADGPATSSMPGARCLLARGREAAWAAAAAKRALPAGWARHLTSQDARELVGRARATQLARQGDVLNAWLSAEGLAAAVPLGGEVLAALSAAQRQHQLSLRAVTRTRKVARTLADLRGASEVGPRDIEVAVAMRGPL